MFIREKACTCNAHPNWRRHETNERKSVCSLGRCHSFVFTRSSVQASVSIMQFNFLFLSARKCIVLMELHEWVKHFPSRTLLAGFHQDFISCYTRQTIMINDLLPSCCVVSIYSYASGLDLDMCLSFWASRTRTQLSLFYFCSLNQ